MRIRYTVTTYKCPVCGKTLKTSNDGWFTILGLILFPLLIFIIPFVISYEILNKAIFKVDIAPVSKDTPSSYRPKTKICPKCGTEVKMGEDFRISYNDLNEDAKREYDNRWWFRVAYFLGGLLILSIAFGFFLISPHPTDKTIGTVFLCLAPVFLLAVIGIVFRWKRISMPKKTHTPKCKENLSITNELKQYKELLDSGIITQEEFDKKKKQLLGL